MTRLFLSAASQADLEAIGQFTEERWGPVQKRRYADLLRQRLEDLLDHPESGSAREELMPGLRCANAGQHLIFYRLEGDLVSVLRVLHHSMDVRLHLSAP